MTVADLNVEHRVLRSHINVFRIITQARGVAGASHQSAVTFPAEAPMAAVTGHTTGFAFAFQHHDIVDAAFFKARGAGEARQARHQ